MRARIIDSGSAEWPALLGRLDHDVCHRPEHAQLAEHGREAGRVVAGVVEDDDDVMLVPLILRSCPSSGLLDAASPRPFAGPISTRTTGTDGERFCHDALASLFRELARAGVVSVYLRPHPLLALPRPALAGHGDVRHHQDSVSIDLERSESDLWGQLRKNHQRDISRSVRRGHTVELDADFRHLARFVDMYTETMHRVDADDHFFLDEAYFLKLRRAAGGSLRLCTVLDGETVMAAGLFTHHGGIADYLYSGTADSYLGSSPLKLLLWEVGRRSKAEGYSVLHLGGGPAWGDSLYRFKSGFSPRTHPIVSCRIVTRPSDYRELVERAGPGAAESTDFFPAYRASGAGPLTLGQGAARSDVNGRGAR